MEQLVTRDSLQALIDQGGDKQMHVIGRALVVLWENQTEDEKATASTTKANGKGFTGYDAEWGTRNAEFYRHHMRLTPQAIAAWSRKGANGYSRIVKYHKQLNEAAKAKIAAKKERFIQYDWVRTLTGEVAQIEEVFVNIHGKRSYRVGRRHYRAQELSPVRYEELRA